MSIGLFAALAVAGSLVLPTLAYLVMRRVRPGDRPRAAKIAAWLCMWIGQLAIPLVLVVMQSVDNTQRWWRTGFVAAAIVYGIAMGIVTIVVGALAGQTFTLGPLLLSHGTEEVVAARAKPLGMRAVVALFVAVFYGVILLEYLPIPGREWAPLVYLATVLIPVGLVALLIVIAASTLREPPWRQPPV